MADAKQFCTCRHTKCPRHPNNQDQGCTPCIEKNLKFNEIPNCFFDKIEGAEERNGDSFEEFAKVVTNFGEVK